MSDEDRLFALVLAALSNSGNSDPNPERMARYCVLVALATLKELNDTNH